MTRPYRLAVLDSHPIQYFAPLYAYLDQDPELNITAFYGTDFSLRGAIDPGFQQAVTWDVDLLKGYASHFLGDRSKTRTPRGFWSLICPEVWDVLQEGEYDGILIYGYSYAMNLLALLAAKRRGISVFMRSETHLGLQRQGWKRWLRDRILSVAYRQVDGFFAIGSANRAYYRSLGVPDHKIVDVPYSVDNERFIRAAALSSVERAEVKRKFRLPADHTIVLYASKFMRRKHPDDLIRAMILLRDDLRMVQPVCLFLVGTGEMESDLRTMAEAAHLENVIFGGFINQSELPAVFAVSDIFVLPAENEPWGLIVNEAMCAGLPVIVSEEVGCVPDLVQDGINGFQVRSGDPASLAQALHQLINDAPRRKAMGSASLALIRNWGFEQCRLGILQALRRCQETR